MKLFQIARGFGFAALAAVGFAGVAGAATLSEADFGGFSSDWSKPSLVDASVTSVSGTTAQNVYDIFAFALPTGEKSITLSFSAGGRMEDSYSAGSTVKYASSPFKWGWDGTMLGEVQIASWSKSDKSFTLNLDDTFGPTLYLALYNTHGVMDYNISGVGSLPTVREDTPAPVPVPAALLLLGSAVGGFGLIGLRRRTAKSKT